VHRHLPPLVTPFLLWLTPHPPTVIPPHLTPPPTCGLISSFPRTLSSPSEKTPPLRIALSTASSQFHFFAGGTTSIVQGEVPRYFIHDQNASVLLTNFVAPQPGSGITGHSEGILTSHLPIIISLHAFQSLAQVELRHFLRPSPRTLHFVFSVLEAWSRTPPHSLAPP